MTTAQGRRRQRINHRTDTLKEHLDMFKKRQEQLKRVGGLTFKEALAGR